MNTNTEGHECKSSRKDDGQAIEESLKHLRELMDSFRKDIKLDSLQTVIFQLQDGSSREEYSCERRFCLIRALLTRYGLHRWIVDLDACFTQLLGNVNDIIALAVKGGVGNVVEVEDLNQLIQECRDLLDADFLDAIIRLAEEILSSHPEDRLTQHKADVSMILGDALLMKYLHRGEVMQLDQATAKFEEAKQAFADDTPCAYICLISLAHIEFLRLMECGEGDAFCRFYSYMTKANAADKEAADYLKDGRQLAENVDQGQLKEAIGFFAASSHNREAPHPRRLVSLHHLSRALLTWFQTRGDMKALENAILLNRELLSLRPSPHPDRPVSLKNLSAAIFHRFQKFKSFDDLQETISLRRECLQLQRPSHIDRSSSLNNLGVSLLTRFHLHGNRKDLEETIILFRESVTTTPSSHAECASYLSNLASALMLSFERTGSIQDLEECISHYREALGLEPVPHPSRFRSLNNLANALFTSFGKKGTFQDLEECILLHREALKLKPEAHPKRASSLSSLASALLSRFEQNSCMEDLEESLVLHQEALNLRPIPHPDRYRSLNGLGRALFARFRHKGVFDDLENSISYHEEAVKLQPVTHPDRSLSLNNLGNALLHRFQQRGMLQDLDRSVALHREALDLTPTGHSRRHKSVNYLGNAFSNLFMTEGSIHHLEQCIALYQEALKLCPLPHPQRTTSLSNLARALFMRSEQKGAFQDLDESISLVREALGLRPAIHSHRSLLLSNLASNLSSRFDARGVLQDLEESILLYREALNLQPVHHPFRPLSLGNLGQALSMRFKHTGRVQDLDESITLHREALGLQKESHANYPLLLQNLARAISYSFEKRSGREDFEECILLHRRALSLRPSPQPARLFSLHGLADALHQRFEYQGEDADINAALNYYEQAAKYQTGSLPRRLISSNRWAICAHAFGPDSVLGACRYGVELLPQLASLDLTLQQRQDVLENGQVLVGNAAKLVINAGRCDMAVTFLSAGRSIFWSQALQLRTPVDQLMLTHKPLAQKFVTISRQLERASYSTHHFNLEPSPTLSGDAYTSLDNLASQRIQILDEIRSIPDYKEFLLPPSFQSLRSAASGGPVILLNASRLGCDAVVMGAKDRLDHVTFPEIRLAHLEDMKILVQALSRTRSGPIEISQNTVKRLRAQLGRDMVQEGFDNSSQEAFRLTLQFLWTKVVQPVIVALGIKKVDFLSSNILPQRIWWCPTGPFTFLPIHAAGIYDENDEPLDCLFQYAVSSYCTSLQDLQHPPPTMNQGFKMTAVIEPEAPGAKPLPATHDELMKIKNHIPNSQDLIAHIGSKDTPTRIDDLLSDIQNSSFTHFGCHGMQHSTNPLESFLLLSGGKLTMSRIVEECKVLEGALAYLSACETAKGDEVRPDESLNLVATMMFAGFRSVVGTMWSIFDEDAPVVADAFYSYLFRNGREASPDVRDAAYGLHLGTKLLREQGKPFRNWVPYVHYGI